MTSLFIVKNLLLKSLLKQLLWDFTKWINTSLQKKIKKMSRLDGLKFHLGKPESRHHHLIKAVLVLTTVWSIYYGKICLITKACQYCLILIIKSCFTLAKNKIDILLLYPLTSSFNQSTVDMFLKNLFPICYILTYTCLYFWVTCVHFSCYKCLSEQIFTLNLFKRYYSEQVKFLNLE